MLVRNLNQTVKSPIDMKSQFDIKIIMLPFSCWNDGIYEISIN